MRTLKILLIVLLVLVGTVFCLTSLSQNISGRTVGPVLECDSDTLDISVSDPPEALLAGVRATDRQDGDLTDRIQIQGVSKLISDDSAKVTYLVFDSDGNMDSLTRLIHYTDYSRPRFSVTEPLRYSANASIGLLDRLQVLDVIDGDITSNIRVSTLSATSDPEIYTVSLQVTNSMGDTARVTLPVILESGTSARPRVELKSYLVYLNKGDTFSSRDYFGSASASGNTLSVSDVEISGTVDTSTAGTYMVYYRCYDNVAVGTAVLTVVVE